VQTARELTNNIITPAEHERLAECGLTFSLALTLAFSAKESEFKASERQTDAGFLDYQIIRLNKQQIIIRLEDAQFAVHW
ncbi:4'-phosphopantetheinyl transferase superfamily protein, partial [Proteus mirabilis]|uniref:4'-phosphopantetheinyl transferase superfamily protein n=1 Tax=Proteus mirabilis TaxID=584 RepID=UPI00112F2255